MTDARPTESAAGRPADAPSVGGRIDHAKLWSVGTLHMGQHFPGTFVGAALPAVFRQNGLPLEMFWLLQIPMIPAAFKWLIAIVVDNVGHARFGYRKSWIVPCTALGSALYLSLAAFEPGLGTLYVIVAILFVKSLIMAAQDVAVDAMAAESMTDTERPVGTAIIVTLVFVGTIVGQAMLAVIDRFGWSVATIAAASTLVIAAAPATIRREPPPPPAAALRRSRGERASLTGFLKRQDSAYILPFLVVLGVGSNFTRALIPAFFVDRGYSLTDIGIVTAIAVGIGAVGGAVLSPGLTRRFGLKRLAKFALCAFPLDAVAFVWMATSDPAPPPWAVALLLGVIIFISTVYTMAVNNSRFRWASKAQAGTDYSFQSSLWNLGQWAGATVAGFAAALLGWAGFFVLAMALNAAGAMLYIWMYDRVEALVDARERAELSG